MRSSEATVIILLVSVATFLRVVTATCNCPGAGGECSLNCTSASPCCGSGTIEPQCLTDGNQCCTWWQGATQCAADESCCGQYGYGASSDPFCCGAGSSCCPTWGDGSSSCCGPKQQCCSGYNSYCCDAETEVCGPNDFEPCLPKFPITPNPNPNPSNGALEWAVVLASTNYWDINGPVQLNETHVACSGPNGTAVIRLADGGMTLVLPSASSPPVVSAGYLIVCNGSGLFTYQLATGQPGWSAMVSCQSLAGNNDTVLVATYGNPGQLIALNSTTGRLKYNVSSGFYSASVRITISQFRTAVVWSPGSGILLQSLDTGKLLLSSGADCEASSVLLVDSLLVTCEVAAYSLRTGKELWSYNASALTLAGIAATSRTIAVAGQNVMYQNYLYILSRGDGSLLHTIPQPNFQGFPTIIGFGETLLAAAGSNVTTYNSLSGKQQWFTSNASLTFAMSATPAPFVYRGYVYLPATASTDPYALVALDSSNGKLSGVWGAGGWILTVLPVGGRVLFASQDGYLYSLKALA